MDGLSIKVNIDFPKEAEVKSKLETVMGKVAENSTINLNINTSEVEKSLKEFSKIITDLSEQLKKSFNGKSFEKQSKEIKKASNEAKEYKKVMKDSLDIGDGSKSFLTLTKRADAIKRDVDKLANVTYNLDSKGKLKDATITYKNELGQIVKETMAWTEKSNKAGNVITKTFETVNVAVNSNLEHIEKLNNNLDKTRDKMQGKLSTASNNGFVDTKVIETLQNKLNSLTTTTPEKEVRKLVEQINNLSSSDNRIVRVQNNINKIGDGLEGLKKTSDKVLQANGNSDGVAKLEEELKGLDILLGKLTKGESVDNAKINSQINDISKTFRNLKKTIKDTENDIVSLEKKANELGKIKSTLNKKLSEIGTSEVVDNDVISVFQDAINSLNTDTAQSEMIQLQEEIETLGVYYKKYEKDLKAISKEANDEMKARAKAQAQAEKIEFDSRIKAKKIRDKELEDYAKSVQKLEKTKSDMQGKLNVAIDSGFIDISFLDTLQKRINELTTKSAESEIEELKKAINGLRGTETAIVKITNELDKMKLSEKNTKDKFGSYATGLKDKKVEESLAKYRSELLKLEELQKRVINGEEIDSSKIQSQIYSTRNAMDSYEKSVQNSKKSTASLGGAIKDIATKVGLFSLMYDGIHAIERSFKSGFEAVKEMDSAVTTLKITMDNLDNSSINNMAKQSQQMAQDLATTTTEVLKVVKVMANANESVETIMAKTSGAMILSNLSGLDSGETAKIILSAQNQFEELADGSEKSVMRVADSIVAISRALKLDFSEGVAGAGEGMKILGSLADQVGMSMEQTLAIMSSTVEKTQMSYSEVATSLKTVISRTLRMGDATGEEALKSEKALNSVGIAIKDNSGNMKDFMDIMSELDSVWDGLSETNQSYIADALGKRYAPLWYNT